MKQAGPLPPAAVDRILWPLLDGLEQVHNAGFLHRDIKPANILLDAEGNPTLIDFGASRAAMAGRSTALTAIFTPGYAAAEQMTSAKQGPWTDIYGLSATLYHAITGRTPPSAFDRMLDDAYEPLGKMAPPGFAPRPAGRPRCRTGRARQRPAAEHRRLAADPGPGRGARWRRHGGDRRLRRGQAVASCRCAAARRGACRGSAASACGSALPPRRSCCWPAATTRWSTTSVPRPRWRPAHRRRKSGAGRAAGGRGAAAEGPGGTGPPARRERAAPEKAEQEAAQRKQIEDETRRKIEAEMADKKRQEDEARQKADAEAAEKKRQEDEARQKAEADTAGQRQADEAAKKLAEAGESGLRLTVLDRQHMQVALNALGFATGSTNGTFGSRTRERSLRGRRRGTSRRPAT